MHKIQGNQSTSSFKGNITGAGGMQPQMGQQMGQYVNPHYGAREHDMVEEVEQLGHQNAYQAGNQYGNQMGSQAGGQTGYLAGHQGMGQQTGKIGAMELMEVHVVLKSHIDGINQFELYRPHVKDQRLMQILDNQVNHMYNSYQNMVKYLQNQGMGGAVPYRAPKVSAVKYGLRQPAPIEPNASDNQMDDRDVASGMMGFAKAGAIMCTNAALECADVHLRSLVSNCAISSINQAQELFQYMNEKGIYQVPTLAEQTTQTMINTYQMGSQPQFQ